MDQKEINKLIPGGYVSASKISRFARCPKDYFYLYRMKLPSEYGYYAKLGRAMHSASLEINQSVMADVEKNAEPEIDRDDIFPIYKRAITEHFGPGEIKISDLRTSIKDLLKYAWWISGRAGSIFKVEEDITIPYGNGVSIRFIMDLFLLEGEDTGNVVDFKNTFQILSKEELVDDYQTDIYGLAILLMLPHLKTIKKTHWMFRRGFANSVSLDAVEFQATKIWLDGVIEGMLSGEYPARLNSKCLYCVGRHLCEEYKTRTDVCSDELRDIEKAHKELEKLTAADGLIDKRRKKIKKFLKDIIEEDGEVLVEKGKRRYIINPKPKRVVNPKEAQAVFANYELDIVEEGATSMAKKQMYRLRDKLFEEISEDEIAILKEQIETVLQDKPSDKLVCEKVLEKEAEDVSEGELDE